MNDQIPSSCQVRAELAPADYSDSVIEAHKRLSLPCARTAARVSTVTSASLLRLPIRMSPESG
jgi:hypothetical protein